MWSAVQIACQSCLVLCFNWQGPIQGCTSMPQLPNVFFWFFCYRAVRQWMRSLLRETGEPGLECAQGPGEPGLECAQGPGEPGLECAQGPGLSHH